MGDKDSTLFDLAREQDKFEHDYTSELVTRIALFLVFAGFISGLALELLKLILADASHVPPTHHTFAAWLLGLSIVLLFAAMVILLRAALMPGYSVPGPVSEYRTHYKELLEYNEGNEEKANQDLRESILDATSEAVEENSKRNLKRAGAIALAARLLLVSIVTLFFSLGAFVFHIE